MTPLYQAPSTRTAWLGHCLPSSLHLLQPPPPLCNILLFSALFPSPFYRSHLCFPLLFSSSICLSSTPPSFHSTPSIISPASQPPSLLSPLTVNNFAFVLFSLESFFFLQKTFVRPLHYLLWRERGAVTGGGVLDKQ